MRITYNHELLNFGIGTGNKLSCLSQKPRAHENVICIFYIYARGLNPA